MYSIGLITEGLTDQVIIEDILIGFLSTLPEEPFVEKLEPPTDRPGSWSQVQKFCMEPERIAQALEYRDFVVIHLDTDICEEYGVSKNTANGTKKSIADLITSIIEKIMEWIGDREYSKISEKIIFAISVHSIECWLLPIYENNLAKKNKTTGCLEVLSKAIEKKTGEYISTKNKAKYMKPLSEPFRKKKTLKSSYEANPSLKIFVKSLIQKFPDSGF